MHGAGQVLSDLSTALILAALVLYGIRLALGHRHDEPRWRMAAVYLAASVLGLLGEVFQSHHGFYLYFYIVIVTLWVALTIWTTVDWYRARRDVRGTENVEECDTPEA